MGTDKTNEAVNIDNEIRSLIETARETVVTIRASAECLKRVSPENCDPLLFLTLQKAFISSMGSTATMLELLIDTMGKHYGWSDSEGRASHSSSRAGDS